MNERSKTSIVIYASVTFAWALYVVLLLLSPNTAETYKLGLTQANFVRLTFAIPVLLIWLLAARAVIGFRSYARLIQGSPESRSFQYIANGLIWLLAYIMSILLMGRITALFGATDIVRPMIFLKNHLPVYLLLVAFAQLYYGSSLLVHQAHTRVPRSRIILIWLGYSAFSIAYTVLFLFQPDQPTRVGASSPSFAVSHNTLFFTLIIPTLVAWILGLLAAINFSNYAYYVRGIIYKAALRSLSQGLYASIIFNILVEILILNGGYYNKLSVVYELILLYCLLLAYAIGSAYIDNGARRLARIEEVA